jgi:hypothetical protein
MSQPLAAIPASDPCKEASDVIWMDNNGVRFPFPGNDGSGDGDDVFDPIHFTTTGVVSAAFLNAGALSHTLKFTISRGDIDQIKTIAASSPDYHPGDQFHWPFVEDAASGGNLATANNKDDLSSPFEHVYDGRTKTAGDLCDDDLLPAHRIRPGVKVRVEYTPTVWSGRKSKDGAPPKFGSGCSLKLMGIVLLEERYNFQSPRKRRRLNLN